MSSLDLESRILCKDDLCIGVIGPNGQCGECGRTEVTSSATTGEEFAPRELCVDDGCIGVVGSDGRCKECGTPGRNAASDPRNRGLGAKDEGNEPSDQELLSAPASFDDRELCPDGSCVGVIRNGKCPECGAKL